MNEIGKPTILLVEDDPLLVKMYKTKFSVEGFLVLSAGDGETGLKMALENKPNLIILDVMMPKLSGIDMLASLRRDPRGKDIPVLILSNLSNEEEAKRALELGAKEYLTKADYTPSEVFAKAKQYLR